MSRRSPLVVLAVVVVAPAMLAGCASRTPQAPSMARPDWQPVTLPLPPGQAGRIVLRDAATCAGAWYVAGGVVDARGDRRPAVWTSTDARTWRTVRLAPASYYARRSTLTAIACRGDRIAAIGSRSGGAHGNPRVSSWYQRADGTLVDAVAPFTLFGGSQAVDVGRLGAGPRGWVIAGNRTSGAAVWTSPDATRFALHDHDAALASDRVAETSAVDVTADDGGWTLVGRALVDGRTGPVPLAWSSPDGVRWTREQVAPASPVYADLQRVLTVDGRVVAVGLRGERLGAWWRDRDRWRVGPAFGRLDPDRRSAPFVSGLAAAGDDLLVSVSDGTRFGVWTGTPTGPWAEVSTPTRPTASGDHQLTVAAAGDTVLLLADDGTTGRAWRARWTGRRG